MKIKHLFISSILLLAYSVGFAHNLTPHDHGDEAHEHTSKMEILDTDQATTFHACDHLGENIYELIHCLFNDVSQSPHYDSLNAYVLVKKSVQLSFVITSKRIFTNELKPSKSISSTLIFCDFTEKIAPIYLNGLHLRGPPIFS